MIGQYVCPLFRPLWAKLTKLSTTYGVTPLSYQIAKTLTLLSALVFMAMQMHGAGVAAFILHFMVVAVQQFPSQTSPNPIMTALHSVGFSAATVFALGFGVADNFGTPIAFLFLSWIILALTNLAKPNILQLIGTFEIGLSVVAMGLAAIYIPAIAILFGLACLVSAGVTFMMGTKAGA